MDFFMKDQHDGISSETINFHGDGDCDNIELKEQDLIKQLKEKESNDGDSGSVLDCALTLAPSGLRLCPMDRSDHARKELVYVPTNCHSNRPQECAHNQLRLKVNPICWCGRSSPP